MIWALHGAVGSSNDWRELGDLLASAHEPIRRIDLWRYLDCCPMPLVNFGKALVNEIERIDSKPVLLGYSMGGRLALHALLEKPELWKAAIIVSAHPGLNNAEEKRQRRESDAAWSASALKHEWSEFLTQWDAQSVLNDSYMPNRTSLKDRRASIARSFIDWSLGAQQNLLEKFHSVSCPVLWITGELDTKFTSLAANAVSFLPNAKHVVVPDAGHRVPWEKPLVFSQVCNNFLQATAH